MAVKTTFLLVATPCNDFICFNVSHHLHLQDVSVRNKRVSIWFPDASAGSLLGSLFYLEEGGDMFLGNAKLSSNYKALTPNNTKLDQKIHTLLPMCTSNLNM
jgi:hypothetical protein